MKLLILVVLLSSVYCSENDDQDELENNKRRIAGGGNYGGFIGLTTYGGGPFLVKGKFERDDNEKDNRGVSKNDNKNNDSEYVRPFRAGDEKKDDDEYLEYLGYRGTAGMFLSFSPSQYK